MAVNDPIQPQPVAVVPIPPVVQPVQVVANTTPDPLRKTMAGLLAATGLLILVLGIVASMFPQMGANTAPALQWGPMLLGSAGFTIWDRQVPSA